MPKINMQLSLSKAFKQKIACATLLTLGIALTVTAVVVPGAEVLLAISIPIGVSGLSILGSILDPRDRYIVSNTVNHITAVATTSPSGKARYKLFSHRAKKLANNSNNKPAATCSHTCIEHHNLNLAELFNEAEAEVETKTEAVTKKPRPILTRV